MSRFDDAFAKTGSVLFSTGLSKYRRPRVVLDSILGRSLEGAVKGRVVMVTGSSEGIGKEVALRAARAGAIVLLVARTEAKLELVREEIEAAGGSAFVHPADLSDTEDIKRMALEVLAEHGRVDVLVNNAGRSIRRSIEYSYDRMHDFERTMQLNYFGALQLILALLPGMRERRYGHIVNISSGGVQARASRFSAYVASKAALDAFSDCVQSEVKHDNVHFTTIFMPLVRTAMIAPTKAYDKTPALTVAQAGDVVSDALIHKPRRFGTLVPSLVMVADAFSPAATDTVRSIGYQLFDDSAAARGDGGSDQDASPTA
ncbi:MAG: 3-oxoacyl-[acyl-carrier protein] reductase, partial [Marmoricola sp.]|nr:3-oxoacyl-[acyl-carrier protein] reductase [Marmoricola sp.]